MFEVYPMEMKLSPSKIIVNLTLQEVFFVTIQPELHRPVQLRLQWNKINSNFTIKVCINTLTTHKFSFLFLIFTMDDCHPFDC